MQEGKKEKEGSRQEITPDAGNAQRKGRTDGRLTRFWQLSAGQTDVAASGTSPFGGLPEPPISLPTCLSHCPARGEMLPSSLFAASWSGWQ
ncbi:hypothetical protein E2C01_101821 [Portunus trituberculatus]|uniref:Uncharacterized protein n=1 Tax=Portunus trituberculatus TaxID=210409 RepID=A0A5B7K6L8_PORTR|nr:hypothetical protein [Portunus trituberculatus]